MIFISIKTPYLPPNHPFLRYCRAYKCKLIEEYNKSATARFKINMVNGQFRCKLNFCLLAAYGIAKSVNKFPLKPRTALTMHQIPAKSLKYCIAWGKHWGSSGCCKQNSLNISIYFDPLQDTRGSILTSITNYLRRAWTTFCVKKRDLFSCVLFMRWYTLYIY